MDYGTGAIMAVPAHDERDREFAETFDLPIVEVITEDGTLVNSDGFDGMPAEEAKEAIVERLHHEGHGAPAVSHRLRDWSFGRQRYWGCPIPIVYCADCGEVPVPDDQLPLILPEVEDYRPKGKPPLATATEWLQHDLPALRRPGHPRGRHDGHVRRLVLVLPPLRRPAQRPARRSTGAWSTTGRRSRTTSAGSTTRPATSSTRASS